MVALYALLVSAVFGLGLVKKPGKRWALPLVVTTANILSDLTPEKAREAIANACKGSHLVGLQEMHRRNAHDFLPGPGWGVVQKVGGSTGRTAILYRTDRLRLVRWANVTLSLSLGFTFGAASRVATMALFQDKITGRYVPTLVVHLVPHADNATGGITAFPRRKLVNASIDSVIRWARAFTFGILVVMGDWNIDANGDLAHRRESDLAERLSTVGLRDVQAINPDRNPTHGRSNQYDRVFVHTRGGLAKVGEDYTRPKKWSDHLAYSVELVISCRKGWPKK